MAAAGPPPGLDLYASEVPSILGATIASFLAALAAVILRFYCRRVTKTKLWWDDWLIIPSIVLSLVALLVLSCWSIPSGYGRHIWILGPDAVYNNLRSFYPGQILYIPIMFCTKCSILCLYWKVFNQSRFRIPIYFLGGLVSLWAVGALIDTLLQCVPVNGYWDRVNPNLPPATRQAFYCGENPTVGFLVNAVPNIITDFLIFVAPIPVIWGLRLPTNQKIAISTIFLLGLFVTGVSIARCIIVFQIDRFTTDLTWVNVSPGIWTYVELHVAIICACLPALKPLLNLFFYGSVYRNAPENIEEKRGDDRS